MFARKYLTRKQQFLERAGQNLTRDDVSQAMRMSEAVLTPEKSWLAEHTTLNV